MNNLAGSSALMRLIIRRDWLKFLIWAILVGVIPVSMAASYIKLYPTPESLRAFSDLVMGSPAEIGMLGFVYASNVGALTAWRAGLNGAFLIVPVSILFVIRHTRSEEQAGRSELLGSTASGRLAPLAASLLVLLPLNLIIAVIISIGLISLGLPATGAWVMGLSAASVGWVFSALATLVAQLTESPALARTITLIIFAFTWFMRTIGDLSGAPGSEGWLSWVSPLGWLRLTRAFAGEQVWVLLLPLLLTILLSGVAALLLYRRDLGAGYLPVHAGPAQAASSLNSPLALSWRLHRNALVIWSIGIAFFGFLLGTVGVNMSGFVDAPQFRAWANGMGLSNAGDAFLFLIIYILGQVISAYGITIVLKLYSEEKEGRADSILAAPVSRFNWAGSHLFWALFNSTILMLILGLSIGLGYGLNSGNLTYDFLRLFSRTLTPLPAIWVIIGITSLFYGWLPRFSAAASWGLLIFFLMLELGWELQQISPALFKISPFAHVHWTIQVSAQSLLVLTAITLLLITGGILGLRQRDMG